MLASRVGSGRAGHDPRPLVETLTKRGVIIISRDRPERVRELAPAWEAQGLPVHVLTEPDQVSAYSAALRDFPAVVVGHEEPDMGVAYARAGSLRLASELGYEAYVMADDDTIPHRGSNVRPLLDFVAREAAVNCGGWLQIHDKWYARIEFDGTLVRKRDDVVLPHFGDKLFATNVALAEAAGGYDVRVSGDRDTDEWNRICVASGFLWWIHAGVRIKEVGAARAEGGINAFHERHGETREDGRRRDHALIYSKWGERYVSHPSKAWRTRSLDFVRDFVGPEAAEAVRSKLAFLADSPTIPRRSTSALVFLPAPEQNALF